MTCYFKKGGRDFTSNYDALGAVPILCPTLRGRGYGVL